MLKSSKGNPKLNYLRPYFSNAVIIAKWERFWETLPVINPLPKSEFNNNNNGNIILIKKYINCSIFIFPDGTSNVELQKSLGCFWKPEGKKVFLFSFLFVCFLFCFCFLFFCLFVFVLFCFLHWHLKQIYSNNIFWFSSKKNFFMLRLFLSVVCSIF